MITLIEVKKGNNESNASLLRRFSRRVKSSGYVNQAKSRKYSERPKSDLKKKREALKRITKRELYEKLKKLGKIRDGFRK
ncbi:MAG: 30S ribosomal protein S21 [Candidatus Paceibacterota bacterium]